MERWDRIGRYAGYGAALALSPYLVVKVSWVIGSLLGLIPIDEEYSLAGWVLLNTVTVGMAAIGIALALALVRPWGMRIPGWLVAFVAWTGSGFLVSVLPYAVVSFVLEYARGDGGTDMPGWMGALLQFSFVGMGLGLALALPAYLKRRWPDAFAARPRAGAGAPWAAAVALVVGAVWMYWALGGTLGLAHPDRRTADGTMLAALGALWALAGGAAVWTLARARADRLPHTLLLALGWIGSGSLFAWSSWKLPLMLIVGLARPSDVMLPESPFIAAALHCAAVAAGIGLLRTLVGPDGMRPGRGTARRAARGR